MGIRVQQALLSSLLIAALFSAPYLQTVRADEEVATSTEAATSEEVASSTEEASTTAPVAEAPSEESESDVGSDSTISSETLLTDDEEGAEEEEDPFTYIKEQLFQTEHLSLALSWNGQVLEDSNSVSLPIGTSGSLQWSYTDHAPTPFIPPPQRHSTSFPDAIAASTLIFQIYRGEIGAATLLYSVEVPYGTYPEIPFTPDEGHYIFVFSSTFPKDTYPPGLSPDEACGGSGDMCVLYQTRIDDFTWFMEHGQALYDDVEDEIDAQSVVVEDGERINRMGRFRPMAFGMVEVSVGAQTSAVSNVLFLPGIKGSRLYHEVSVCNGVPGVCDETLWEPYGDVLARKLFLDSDGNSEDEVFVKEGQIIDEAGGHRFYKSFIDDMNSKDASDEYGVDWKWRPVAYDWRLSLPNIIHSGAKYGDKIYYDQATSTPYIEQTLRELAHSSPTGKVTIVAHSNGGLVAKALMQELGDEETASLVDKVILVGVPQSGAPQALGGLLFGYDEGIPGKWFTPNIMLSKEVARELAENSPMAYHLMPSNKYLQDVQDPNHSIVGFSGSHLYQAEQASYGSSVDTVDELDGFLLAREGGREKPAYANLTVANILNPNLISYANSTHDSLDSWVPPASVTLYQIAGWGANTVSGIDFYDEQKVLGTTVGYKRQYRPIFVEDGDGVVPVPSALLTSTASNVHDYWLDLSSILRATSRKYDHGSIFEAASTRQFIADRLQNSDLLPNFITSVQPKETSPARKLIFQLHSPLTLGLYDSSGNYTGLNEDGTISEQVQGVEYGEFGDVKYLIAPAGTQYQLVMNGQSNGTFSLDIQEHDGDTLTTTTIADVPTTANTVAKLSITNGITDASTLAVDSDGDGTNDIQVAPVSGQTVQYTIPSETESTVSAASGSAAVTKNVVSAAPAFTVPLTSVPLVLKSRTLGAKVVMNPVATSDEVAVAEDLKSQSQTASVYDAFAPFTKWLLTLMYNIWKALLNILTVL